MDNAVVATPSASDPIAWSSRDGRAMALMSRMGRCTHGARSPTEVGIPKERHLGCLTDDEHVLSYVGYSQPRCASLG